MASCTSCAVRHDDRCKKCKNYLVIDPNSKYDVVREDFCPSCLVVPLAVAGASATGVAVSTSGKNKMRKKILLWAGIITIVLSILIGVYYLMNKKTCLECKL